VRECGITVRLKRFAVGERRKAPTHRVDQG
jgi:hypothetical protein